VEPPGPSYDAFYAEHFRPISMQLYAYFGESGDAADVTQEAFCRAWQRWSTVRCYDDPAAWVRRVAWRLAISRWRRVRTAWTHRPAPVQERTPEMQGVRVDLIRALATLPVAQRRAVVLYYLADLSVGEIAADAGVAQGTVKSWLSRGRSALRSQLESPDDARITTGSARQSSATAKEA
jgi:RNA polymerase sigma-70 factor (ECF subfamily)